MRDEMQWRAGILDDSSPVDDLSDLTCPSCGADLVDDERFISHRVCSDCGRHFSIPARARLELIVDRGSFQEITTPGPLEDDLANDQISAIDRISEQYERPVLDEAIVVGSAEIAGSRVVVISMDDQLLGAHIGALATEKIITGLERALARRLPVVAFCAGGAARTQAGPLAMVQGARLAAIAAQVQVAGVPMIAVLSHPTSAEIFGTFASQCDLIFAEPGTQVGVTANASRSLEAVERALTDEDLVDRGWIDGVVPRPQVRQHLADLLDVLGKRGGTFETVAPPPGVPDTIGPDDRNIRLRGVEFLPRMVSSFVEMRGDRVDADGPRVTCGFGRIGDVAVAVVAQDHAASREAGQTAPIRKAQRLARLAGRFEMPLVLVVDCRTDDDVHIVRPDESLAIAKLGSLLAMLPIPVISVAVGPVRGSLGTVLMTGDRRLMLEQAAYYLDGSAVSRGGRFPIPSAGGMSRHLWPARECERLGLVDVVIPEPETGAQADPGWTAMTLKVAISRSLAELASSGPRRLVEARHQRHRMLGQETEEGLAAIRFEMREWQEVQQSVAKSIEDLRERFGQRMPAQPKLSIQRPDLGELAARLRARREELRLELLERTGRGERP